MASTTSWALRLAASGNRRSLAIARSPTAHVTGRKRVRRSMGAFPGAIPHRLESKRLWPEGQRHPRRATRIATAKQYYPVPQHARCFFSFFGQKEDEKREKKVLSESEETFPPTTSNDDQPIDSDRTWEDRYRRPITRELWNEFRGEGVRLRKHLSEPSSPSYLRLAAEIQSEVSRLWNEPSAPPESGPTGRWVYEFTNRNDPATRCYQRYPAADTGKPDPAPQIVLELDAEAEIGAMSLTPNESCVACLLQGKEGSTIKLRGIDSGKETVLEVSNGMETESTIVGLEWGPILARDNIMGHCRPEEERTSDPDPIVYSLYLLLADNKGRPNRVQLCPIDPSTLRLVGAPQRVYESEDPSVMVDVQRTKGCSHVAIRALSKTSSEVFLSPDGDGSPSGTTLVRPRQERVVYHVDVGTQGDVLLLTSDEKHPSGGDYVLEETSVSELPLPPTTEMPAVEDGKFPEFFVEDMDLFRTHLVLYERSRRTGDQRVRVQERNGNKAVDDARLSDVILDVSSIQTTITGNSGTALPWSKLSPVGNMCFDATSFRFELESPVTPGTVCEYDFQTQNLRALSGGGGSSEPQFALKSEKILVEGSDGTDIPLSLFFRDTNKGDSTGQDHWSTKKTIVLVGYGAYGEPMDLGYNPGWQSLLDRDLVVAFAHTRGGGDLGRAWYASGRNEHKIRSIQDYESCARYLRERFGGTLVAKAFSAGGVLVGAAVNRNPGLFDRVILTNAFLDVASTMKRSSLYLTEHEYDEFGNPSDDSAVEERIRSYCPIHNLDPELQSQRTSTKFLLIGTLDDPNVPYWNASLYFRKLLNGYKSESIPDESASGAPPKDKRSDNNCVFLELQTDGGHQFSGPNRIEIFALENAFILNE